MKALLAGLTMPLFVVGAPLGYAWGALSNAFALGLAAWDSHWNHS